MCLSCFLDHLLTLFMLPTWYHPSGPCYRHGPFLPSPSSWVFDFDLLCHQPIYSLPRIKNYVFGTPSPNISLMFKIVRRKFLIGLHAEENFHHERAKHVTIYELQKQSVYHIEDISLRFLVLNVPKILSFFLFPTVYNTGYCLSTELYFTCILYDYTMAMLFLKRWKLSGEKGLALLWRYQTSALMKKLLNMVIYTPSQAWGTTYS